MLVAAALSKREKATGRGLMLVKQCMVRKHAHLLPATQYAAMRSNVVLQPQASNGGKKRGADSGPKGLHAVELAQATQSQQCRSAPGGRLVCVIRVLELFEW